jgi:hypothetical protein
VKTGKGWASFSACSSGEIAHDHGEYEQGAFSYYLCEGLSGKAANECGEVTLERLVDYVKTAVDTWSSERGRMQTPYIQSEISGKIVLTLSAKPAPLVAPGDDNPLGLLHTAITDHLARVSEDTRNLAFTDESQAKTAFDLILTSVKGIVAGFTHPAYSVSIGSTGLSNLRAPSEIFAQEMGRHAVNYEFRHDAPAITVHFSSREVVVPTTRLTVALARFSFFYWIWYCHECPNEQLQGTFTAEPRLRYGFFTFKPFAALDSAKIDSALKEILKWASDDAIRWAKQLADYVDSRMKPMREIGKIIG